MAEKVASFRLKEYKINKASIEFDPDKPLSKMSIEIERKGDIEENNICLLYTSPSPRDGLLSRMPSSA